MNLHHVGILVQDLSRASADYVRRFGYEVASAIIHDPVQTAYVQFLKLPGDSAYLELISPDRPESKLTNALNQGGGLNHLCYATDDLEGACRQLQAQGLFPLQPSVPAVAFRGRRIAWFVGRDNYPIELVETARSGEAEFASPQAGRVAVGVRA
jgi:methylmalonyl-CoA/ethylmalonyl-CoA epimerase